MITYFVRFVSNIECVYLFRDHISASQPEPRRLDSGIGSGVLESVDDERTINGLCFSQPVHLDHMLLSTQMQCTPGASQVSGYSTSVSFPSEMSSVVRYYVQAVEPLLHCKYEKAVDKKGTTMK